MSEPDDKDMNEKIDKLLGGIDAIASMCDDMKKRHDALSERMDALEGKHHKPEGDDAHRGTPDDDDEGFDDLPDHERESLIGAQVKRGIAEGKAPGEARETAFDAARKRFDDARAGETPRARRARIAERVAAAWTRADSIAHGLGETAPHAMSGELLPAYRRRLARQFQPFSKEYRDVDLGAIVDHRLFNIAEARIYADAAAVAKAPHALAPEGGLFMKTRTDHGHTINEFYGSPSAWMNPLAGPQRMFVKRFNVPNRTA